MSDPVKMDISGVSQPVVMKLNDPSQAAYVTREELLSILEQYVTKTELANEPTIVRWTGGNS